jgi:phosphoribosylformylglycinamidine synthase
MALLGWVPGGNVDKGNDSALQLASPSQPRFVHNESGRFESRFSTVKVHDDGVFSQREYTSSALAICMLFPLLPKLTNVRPPYAISLPYPPLAPSPPSPSLRPSAPRPPPSLPLS